ncbi:hypothetical protein MAR_023638 [Mya arenaria]|uniref:Uncharacterized protein n=1 Tax=Mya arenaria TaxID=6604 RepID=A0ABY7DSE1_MYAAR|nr:hypothetical protein MAR_023605 [Mya arenaria]WAQ99265.1 hypothetical protein MAR_023638 [Mya arenaria]
MSCQSEEKVGWGKKAARPVGILISPWGATSDDYYYKCAAPCPNTRIGDVISLDVLAAGRIWMPRIQQ